MGPAGHVCGIVERVAVWVYLLSRFTVLPVLVPSRSGPSSGPGRRRVIAVLRGARCRGRVSLAARDVPGPVHAVIDGRHISYEVDALARRRELTALYVVARVRCAPRVEPPRHRRLGVMNLVAVRC